MIGERAANGSLCVEQQWAERAYFWTAVNREEKTRSNRSSACGDARRDSHTLRGYEKTHAH